MEGKMEVGSSQISSRATATSMALLAESGRSELSRYEAGRP